MEEENKTVKNEEPVKSGKKHKVIKVICIILFSIFAAYSVCCFVLIGIGIYGVVDCATYRPQVFASGDYIYSYYKRGESDLTIIGLTEQGLTREYLVIPEEIDGKRVVCLGITDGRQSNVVQKEYGVKHSGFQSENLKKVFKPISVELRTRYGWGKGTVLLNAYNLTAVVNIGLGDYPSDLPDERYVVYFPCARFGDTTEFRKWRKEMPADIRYDLNYDGAPNGGYYYSDDYDGGLIDFIPPEPEREGFDFAGWFRDADCTERWDFATDTVPEKVYVADNYVFNQTTLYAGWTAVA